MIDLTQTLVQKYRHEGRKIGRYNASDLWGIVNGYATPQTWLLGHSVKPQEAYRMWQGKWKHRQVQELLGEMGYVLEQKQEVDYGDFTLVGMVDAMNSEFLLEIKTSEQVIPKAKEWHRYQTKIYCSMFNLSRGYVVQPVVKGQSIILKNIGMVKKDDEWFKRQLDLLSSFHQELLYESKNKI